MNQVPSDNMTIVDRMTQAQAQLDASLAEDRKKPHKQIIPIAKIAADPALQMREALKMERVQEYAAVIREGSQKLPPIRAFYEVIKDCYWVPDGWHRKAAHEAEGQTEIEAIVSEGTRADAIAEACKANATHGEPRTAADKKRAVRTLLLELPEWRSKSDRQIAKACALTHHDLAGAAYRELVSEGLIPARETMVTTDGRTYQAKPKAEAGVADPPHLEETGTQEDLPLPPKISTPKSPAPKCDCGKLAYDGKHCMKCAAEAAQQKSRLSISTPEERAALSGPSLYDEGERKAAARAATPPKENTPSIEESVDIAIAKAGPLDPRTALPKQTAGVESSTPDKEKEESYQHWNTPRWVVELVKRINKIALDPFHNLFSLVGALYYFTAEDNGMREDLDWSAISRDNKGLVYCNPPYEKPYPIAERIIKEAKRGAEVVACLPTSHSTEWYRLLRKSCQSFATMNKKVGFGREGSFNGSARHETTLFYFGPQAKKFRAVMEFAKEGEESAGYVTDCAPYVAPADERQGELPRLAAPPQSAPAENVPNVRTCPNCGEASDDLRSGGVCDECSLDGIECGVCFGDIANVGTATILTPATMTSNATWSCASCEAKKQLVKCGACGKKIREEESFLIGLNDPARYCSECTKEKAPNPDPAPYMESAAKASKEEKAPKKKASKKVEEELPRKPDPALCVLSTRYIGDCRNKKTSDRWYCDDHLVFDPTKEEHEQQHTQCQHVENGVRCTRCAWQMAMCVEHYMLPSIVEALRLSPKERAPAMGCYCVCDPEEFISQTEMEAHDCETWRHLMEKARAIIANTPALVKLHKTLKDMAAKYQRDGFEVSVWQPRAKGSKSVMGAIASIRNQDVSWVIERDDADGTDAWVVKFDSAPGVGVCSLHAVKKEASKETPLSPLDKDLAKLSNAKDDAECLSVFDKLIDKYRNNAEARGKVQAARQTWLKEKAPTLTQEEPTPRSKPKMKECPDCGVKRREGDDYERHRLVHLPKKSTKKAGAR